MIDASGLRVLVERLIPLATVITPNVDEAAALTGLPVTNLEQMRASANQLHAMGAAAVVITGGHLEKAIDLLSFTGSKGIEQEVFKSDRQKSNSTHGTGCAFATAMSCHLARGRACPRQFSSPRPTLPRRLPMPTLWDEGSAPSIISTACTSKGES